MSAFDRLIEQIDAFIRKYYKNEMWKGLIIFIGFLFSSWLLVSGLEYFGRFSSTVRLSLLIFFILGNILILGRYFIRPLLSLFSYGKRITRNQAAKIIGSFFPSISDRLLNTLQLNEVTNPNDRSFELIRASVSQRSNDLSVVPFVDAVKVNELKKYAKYVIPILLLFVSVLIFAPYWIFDGSKNVVNFSQAQAAPFNFSIQNTNKSVNEGESFTAQVTMSGAYIPEYVFIMSDRGKYLMQKTGKNQFSYTFENMKQNMNYHMESEGFSSTSALVQVIGKAGMGRLEAGLVFPKYLNRKPTSISNVAELNIPEGTTVNWLVEAKNVKSIAVGVLNKMKWFNQSSLKFTERYTNPLSLKFLLKNNRTNFIDSNSVQINVVKDAFPLISVQESVDSMKASVRSFYGQISDDYGLSSLTFTYTIDKKEGKSISKSLTVKKPSGVSDKFSFAVDFSRENISVSDKIYYHFSVYDNDGVNGAKKTISQNFTYELPSLSELNEQRDELQTELQNSLKDVLKKAEDFQKNVDKLQKDMLNKQKSDFKSLEKVQQLKQQQQSLEQELKNIQEKLENSNEEQENLTEQDEELLKEQELIEKLLEELMDDELKKMLEEMEKLMQQNQQQQLQQESEKLEENSEDMKKQLDRTLEMLKRLQVNEKIDALEKELQTLAEDQEALKEKEEKGQISEEEAGKKQDELNKKFDELKEDLEELMKLNKDLSRPMELSDFEEIKKEIDKEQDDAKENLDNKKSSKAQQNQKKAAEQMKKMADQLNQEQEANKQKEEAEDMSLLRLLLENLMSLSFDQEHNLQAFKSVRDQDPYYRKLGRRQQRIIDDTKIVEDSLYALAKRQTKIAVFVDDELKAIRNNFRVLVDDIDEHRRTDISNHQQLVMTGYNNLALLLNESLQSMQQEQQQKEGKPGSGSCDKPGGTGGKKPGKKPMDAGDMKEMLKKQLDQMKKGPAPGGKKPGDKPGEGNAPGMNGKPGESGMPGLGNKEVAKMAAQQTAIRQRLEQMRNEMNKEGNGKGNQLNPLIKELEEQEKQLLNKNFSPEMIKRQQDILTRLLESDKALRERGFEEKRESKSGKDQNFGNLIRFDEYNKIKNGQIELLRAVDPMLSRYYRDKAGQYFNLSM